MQRLLFYYYSTDSFTPSSTASAGAHSLAEVTNTPLRNNVNVGMLIDLYLLADSCLSSTLIFAIVTLSPILLSSFSSSGASILQGPHHGAQKSTSTHSFLSSVCCIVWS